LIFLEFQSYDDKDYRTLREKLIKIFQPLFHPVAGAQPKLPKRVQLCRYFQRFWISKDLFKKQIEDSSGASGAEKERFWPGAVAALFCRKGIANGIVYFKYFLL